MRLTILIKLFLWKNKSVILILSCKGLLLSNEWSKSRLTLCQRVKKRVSRVNKGQHSDLYLIHLVIRENNSPSPAPIQWAIVGSRDVSLFRKKYSPRIQSFIVKKPWFWKSSLSLWITKIFKNGLFIFVDCVKL